jgi:peroxiredoxin
VKSFVLALIGCLAIVAHAAVTPGCPPLAPRFQAFFDPLAAFDPLGADRHRQQIAAAVNAHPDNIEALLAQLRAAPQFSTERAAIARDFEARLRQNPDDPLALTLAGYALWDSDAEAARAALRRAIALVPGNGWALRHLRWIDSTERLRDDANADADAVALQRACPRQLDGYELSSHASPELAAASLARLDRMLATADASAQCRAQPLRWDLRRQVRGGNTASEGDQAIRDWIARQRRRDNALPGACLLAARQGYERLGDTRGIVWAEKEIVRRYPTSNAADDIARQAFARQPAAQHRFDDGAHQLAYFRALEVHADERLRIRPRDGSALLLRLHALQGIGASASELSKAALALLAVLPPGDGPLVPVYPLPGLVVAQVLAQVDPLNPAVDRLAGRVARAGDSGLPMPPDYLSDEGKRWMRRTGIELLTWNRWLAWDTLATAALNRNEPAKAQSICESMERQLAKPVNEQTASDVDFSPTAARLSPSHRAYYAQCRSGVARAQGNTVEAADILRVALADPTLTDIVVSRTMRAALASLPGGDGPAASASSFTKRAFSTATTAAPPAAAAAPVGDWVSVDRAVPSLELVDAEGHRWNLAQLRGKTVLVNFWATWCSGCVVEMPYFVRLQQRLHARGDMAVVSASLDAQRGQVTSFLERNRYRLDVSMLAADDFQRALGVISLPQTWIIDTEGRLRYMTTGFGTGPGWVDRTLAQMTKAR